MRASVVIFRLLPLFALGSCRGSLIGAPLEEDGAGTGGALNTSIESKSSDPVGSGGMLVSLGGSMHELATSQRFGAGGAATDQTVVGGAGSGEAPSTQPAGGTFGAAGAGGSSTSPSGEGGQSTLPSIGGTSESGGAMSRDSSVGNVGMGGVGTQPITDGTSEITSVRSCQVPNRCPGVWITITNAGLL